jgi:geranylgeranyl diphosphate synthase, type II
MTAHEFERRYATLRRLIDRRTAALAPRGRPADLNDGCRFVLSGGGKRIRAVLVLLSCEAVGGRIERALDAGVAVETLHNFTLVHDDIMDNASSRRGRPTVHTRWNINTALLVGDSLMGLAYMSLSRAAALANAPLTELLTDGLLEICEGQALDLEFEQRRDVTIREYFTMIEKKTGRLLSVAAEIGGLVGGGTARQTRALREFGSYLGRAFQLQDDVLDVIADQARFGKQIGGDIVAGKKTFLLLKAAERARGKDRTLIARMLARREPVPASRRARLISDVTELYQRYGVIAEAKRQVQRNTTLAMAALGVLPRNRATSMLRWLSDALVHRIS